AASNSKIASPDPKIHYPKIQRTTCTEHLEHVWDSFNRLLMAGLHAGCTLLCQHWAQQHTCSAGTT
ncbi:MAG TPA: hypothetical protein PK858_11460, partial [Saprospiraceae bacterium]|nr:hypothetical protein [Saprospiraceae bacterium]